MPTIRRYVRVSKYTVLECRIFLDNPSLLTSWLLSPRFQILPQLFAAVEPLVLPKLREEREAAASAVGKKKVKSVRDFVVGDGFEASIFLVDSGSRYAVMTKVKSFREPGKAKMRSNSRKLISVSSESRIEQAAETDGGEGEEETGRRRGRRRRTDIEVRQESTSSAEEERLSEIPVAPPPPPPASLHKRRKSPTPKSTPPTPSGSRPAKRPKTTTVIEILDSEDEEDAFDPAVHVEEEDESEEGGREDEEEEDKKKLTLTTKYEGFEIWGRVLCIVVKRTATAAAAATVDIETGKGKRKGKGKEREEEKEKGGGAGMIEEWIAMSQAVREGDEDGG